MEKNYRKTIVVGDIHGMFEEFKQLLSKIDFDNKLDLCVCAGDLVDRGPQSAAVVDFIMKNNIIVTIGNHDEKYIRYYNHEQKKINNKNYKNPMRFNDEKRKIWNSLSETQIRFLQSQPYIFPLPKYNSVVVHAGILPHKPLYNQEKHTYIYVRYVDKSTYKMLHFGPDFTQPKNSVHWTELYFGSVDIIYGHHVLSMCEPVIKTNINGGKTIGIDTGACFGGYLSAIVFSEQNISGEIVQIKSNQKFGEHKLQK